MKRYLLLILLTLFASALSLRAQSTDRLFSDLVSLPGVEAAYIGPAAIRFAGNMNAGDFAGDMSQAISNIKSIEVVECSNDATFPKIKTFAADLVKRLGLELMMENTDEDEIDRIYCTPTSGESSIQGMFIESVGPDEYSLVFISGTINVPGTVGQ